MNLMACNNCGEVRCYEDLAVNPANNNVCCPECGSEELVATTHEDEEVMPI